MLKKNAHNYLEHIILKKTPPTVDKVFAIMNFDICLDRLIKQLVSYWGVNALISWQAYSVLFLLLISPLTLQTHFPFYVM